MKIDKLLLWLITLLIFFGCGPCMQAPPQPKAPTRVTGWEDRFDKSLGIHFHAVLLLKKGESSQNSKFGVRVVEILDASPCCYDPGPSCYRRARIQFYNPMNGQPLCEIESAEQSNTVIGCASELGVSVIGIAGINSAEGWVCFDLRG